MNTQVRGFRRHYTLFVLFLISAVSLIDRQVMGVVIEPIKAEFHVSDTRIGLLTGRPLRWCTACLRSRWGATPTALTGAT